MLSSITYEDHAVDVLAQAVSHIKTGIRFALITSVEIKGGSARDLGSLAVASEQGDMTGYMSNGCIDQDILLHAMDALQTGVARLLRYGEGSPFHDLTLPCGGALSVWIDPTPDHTAILAAYRALRGRKPATLTFRPRDDARPVPALTVCYQPKVSLSLAGRGAILRTTARIAKASGFEVKAYSPDLADLAEVAEHCIEAPIHMRSQNSMAALKLDATSGFLTLFHDHNWEPECLIAALATPVRFIGALGSRQTQIARLAMLAQRGISDQDLKRVRGPIGLVPSLRDASLIAVSALAEVAQAFAYDQQRATTAQQSHRHL